MKSISRLRLKVAPVVLGFLMFGMQGFACAADITLLCAGALETWMHEVIPNFQKMSGHTVKPTFGVINAITEHVRKGEVADLAIVSPQQWEDLLKEGKLDPTIRSVVAKVGFGVFVKEEAARPDISSAEMLRRALLNARGVAVFVAGTGGPTPIYVTRLFDRLGISADLQPKLKTAVSGAIAGRPTAAGLFNLVAKGDAEIGVAQISEILAAPGVQLAGPVPADLQSFTSYATVIPANAKEPGAAKAFVEFLASPEAIAILKAKGLEPG
jgi:molybdate transport system substrate-binding protein